MNIFEEIHFKNQRGLEYWLAPMKLRSCNEIESKNQSLKTKL